MLEHYANGFEAQISIYKTLNTILILYLCLSVSCIWHQKNCEPRTIESQWQGPGGGNTTCMTKVMNMERDSCHLSHVERTPCRLGKCHLGPHDSLIPSVNRPMSAFPLCFVWCNESTSFSNHARIGSGHRCQSLHCIRWAVVVVL